MGVNRETKNIVNQDIIDFRYKLIEEMYPGSVSNIPGLQKNPELDMETMNWVLRKFNIHFGIKYELG